MVFLEYKENTKRTLPTLGKFNNNPIILDSLHMTVGMFSEIYELHEACEKQDKANVGEELTDIAWYASNYCNIRNIEVLGIYNTTLELDSSGRTNQYITSWTDLVNSISELQDYDKKEFAYNKSETESIKARREESINTIFVALNNLYALEDLQAEQQMQNNIDKLRVRFPTKFNNFDANNRNLSEERKKLEQ